MITETQRARRLEGIGASECAAVLGLDQYKTPHDVWLIKTGRATEEVADNEAMEWGNLLEPVIAQQAGRTLGKRVVRSTATFKADCGILFANPDYFVERCARGEQLVECKDTTIAEGWGEPGTDQVPERVLVQVCVQMLCAESDAAHVARLLHRFGRPQFALYTVRYDAEVGRRIQDSVIEFWRDHIEADVPPTGPVSLPVAQRMIRQAGKRVQVSNPFRTWSEAKDILAVAERAEEEAKAALLASLGDGEEGIDEAGNVLVTYRATKDSVRLDGEALRREMPAIHAQFSRMVPGYRRLVRKGGAA